jgi:hypothetical protein
MALGRLGVGEGTVTQPAFDEADAAHIRRLRNEPNLPDHGLYGFL